ncbi:MAG: 50S ribosomal protein L10 [Lacipirellulaceae bacterium]
MSKFVKELIAQDLSSRWEGVTDLLTVDVMAMETNSNVALRKRLREKNIQLLVVKNSLARKATEGTCLAPAFEGSAGSLAVVWGGEDIVSLAKEVTAIAGDKAFAKFEPRGGVLDGSKLSADEVAKVSKWPTRTEMLSTLMGQILGPGATLSAQLLGPGAKLASQIKKKADDEESPAAE